MKIICENSLYDDTIFVFLEKNDTDNRIRYNDYRKNSFTPDLLNEIINKQTTTEGLSIIINIKTEEDLLRIIKIINVCNNYCFILNLCENDLPQREILKIMNQKINNKDNVRIKYQIKSNDISYNEYNDMYKYMYKIVEEVESLNMSPYEQVMYVFDIVKSRIYKDDEEDLSKSRDLYKVLNSDCIVCVGYSNMMEFILKELGHDINSLSFIYDNTQIGHVRNSINIKDDKYEIDNVLFIDVTCNRKISENDDEYINFYTKLLVPYRLFKMKDHNEHFADEHYSILEYSKQSIEKKIINKTYLTDEKDRFLILHSLRQMCNRKKTMGRIITMYFSSQNTDKLLETYNQMYKYYCKLISSDKFFECLFNVRKKQVETGRIDHMPNIDEFEQIMIKNYGQNYFYDQENILISIIFDGKTLNNKATLIEKYNELCEKKLTKSFK